VGTYIFAFRWPISARDLSQTVLQREDVSN
jgi:hypothetical protein